MVLQGGDMHECRLLLCYFQFESRKVKLGVVKCTDKTFKQKKTGDPLVPVLLGPVQSGEHDGEDGFNVVRH